MNKYNNSNIIIKNKKILIKYDILEKFEAGIALKGWEVKSIKDHKIQIINSYISIKNGEAWLLNCTITPLLSTSKKIIINNRIRKLLLTKNEINKILGKIKQKKFTCIPFSIYLKKQLIKLEIVLAKNKKNKNKIKINKYSIKKEIYQLKI